MIKKFNQLFLTNSRLLLIVAVLLVVNAGPVELRVAAR